jgi:hypothetical protein
LVTACVGRGDVVVPVELDSLIAKRATGTLASPARFVRSVPFVRV